MRRKLFYLSVALLAFGTSWLIFTEINLKNSLESSAEKTLVEIKSAEQNADDKIQSVKFSCDDEAINTVWKMLMKNKIFLDDAYVNVVQSRKIKDCRELFEVRSIQTNGNESNEFVVIGSYLMFCGSGGNCQTWIVSKKNNNYQIVFYSTTGDSTMDSHSREIIEPLNAKTHGFNDLKVFIPNGWDADNIGYFKFDGNKYQLKRCLKDSNSAYVYENDYVEKWVDVKSAECLKHNWL